MTVNKKKAKSLIALVTVFIMILTLIPYQVLAYGTKPSDSYGVDMEWYNFRNNQENNGVTEAETPINDETAMEKWSQKYGSSWSDAPTPPLILNDKLYIGVKNKVLEIDKESGKVIRESDAMYGNVGYGMNPILYADGKLFVQVGNGVVQALDLETLKCIWHTDKIGGQTISPISYTKVDGKGYIYTGTYGNGEQNDGTFFCVSTDDTGLTEDTESTSKGGGMIKSAQWQFTPSINDDSLKNTENAKRGFYWAGAYACENYIAVGTDDGTKEGDYTANAVFYTINPKTGEIIDRIDKIKGDIRTTVVYDSGHLYFSTKGGTLYKIDVDEKGNLSNESYIELNGMTTAAPLVYKNKIYLGVAGEGGQFDPDGGHAFKVVDNSGTLSQDSLLYELPIPGYPQSAALLSNAYENEDFDGDGKADGRVYLYFTYNSKPGGIYYTYDSPDADDALDMGKELYVPDSDKQNYCISTICTDDEGTLYYKNDSNYLMAVETNPAVISNIELTADDGTTVPWNKTFDQKIKDYEVRISESTKSISVKLNLPDGISAEVNGQKYTENMSVDVSGDNPTLEITSKLGEYTKTYTINIVKNLGYAEVSSLKINQSNSISGTAYQLSPEFSSDIYEYKVDLTRASVPSTGFYRLWMNLLNPNAEVEILKGENISKVTKVETNVTNSNTGYFYGIYPKDVSLDSDITIKVTAENGSSYKEYHVSFEKGIPVTEVILDKTEITMDITDDCEALTATVKPDNATVKDIVWSVSSDNDEATVEVDNNGQLTPLKEGKSTVTASAINKVSAECQVTVTDKAAKVMNKIEKIKEVTLESKADIDVIVSAYNALNEKQKARADELGYKESIKEIQDAYDKLIKDKEEADKAAAKAVTDKINAIGDNITLESKQTIVDARAAYEGLTADQKALISDEAIKVLEAAENKIAQLELNKSKNDAISEINEYKKLSDYRAAQQEEIKEIISKSVEMINKATDKKEIDNVLKDAKSKMDAVKTDAQLTAEEQAKEAADQVKKLIEAIGNVGFNEESRDAIKAAKEAYDALKDEAKSLVDNIDVLKSAQDSYNEIVKNIPITAKEDSKSGISISSKFMEGTKLTVKEAALSDTNLIKESFKKEKIEVEKYLSAYDIHIDGGYEGEIFIIFDVGKQYDGRNVAIKHLLDDGTIETYTITVKNGKVSLTVDSLSPFVLALLEKVDIPACDLSNEGNMSGNTTNISSDKIDTIGNATATGDERNISDPIALMLLGVTGLIVLLITRKKRNN